MNQRHPDHTTRPAADPPSHLTDFQRKMQSAHLPDLVIDTFAHYYQKLRRGESGLISDQEIRPVDPSELAALDALSEYRDDGFDVFKHAVRITLNGGLGTSMGLSGAKSLLPVKDGRTFLEIIIAQTERRQNRLALMNSFNTHTETMQALEAWRQSPMPLWFLQHKFPKILQKDLSPATWPPNRELEWNPPGHGDVYSALYTSGLLQQLLEEDIRYAFISNSDNLGATMDGRLLGYMARHQFPFMMEVAAKTPTDVKGGHLARHDSGHLLLREIAQCPEEDLASFRDIDRHRFFNTNNIWVDLTHLQRLFQTDRMLRLPMIVNPKTLDPRDDRSPAVFQIETAMGAAISLFEGAIAVQVPRSRFFPVKTCNDLLAIRSDGYVLDDDRALRLNPRRDTDQLPPTIAIRLDPAYFGKIDQFEDRFDQGVPSLVHCHALTVNGDVRFEADVTVQGEVEITNPTQHQAVVPSGTTITENLVLNPTP